MFEFLNLEQSATIHVLLTIAGSLTVVYVGFRLVSWLIRQIAILFTWVMRGLVAAALSRILWEWAVAKLSLSDSIRSLML